VVATTIAALIFLGSLVADQPFAMIYPTGFLFCYSLAKEIIWDIYDAEGDLTKELSPLRTGLGSASPS